MSVLQLNSDGEKTSHTFYIICQGLKEAKTKVIDLEKKWPRKENETSISFSEIKNIIGSLQEVEIPKLQKQLDDWKSNRPENGVPETKLEEEIQALKEELIEAKSKIDKLEKENQQLNHRLTALEERSQKSYVDGGPLRLPVQASEQHNAMSRLSDLACVILSILYKIVLPDSHTSALNSSYTVERIERDIKKLPMSKEDREKAKDRWESLKTDLSLTDDKYEVLSSLRESRNVQECKEELLDEEHLRRCARILEEENLLKGWVTMEHVSELIEIWKTLTEKVKSKV